MKRLCILIFSLAFATPAFAQQASIQWHTYNLHTQNIKPGLLGDPEMPDIEKALSNNSSNVENNFNPLYTGFLKTQLFSPSKILKYEFEKNQKRLQAIEELRSELQKPLGSPTAQSSYRSGSSSSRVSPIASSPRSGLSTPNEIPPLINLDLVESFQHGDALIRSQLLNPQENKQLEIKELSEIQDEITNPANRDKIQAGKSFLKNMYLANSSSVSTESTDNEQKIKTARNIIWALYDIARQKKQLFYEGTFLIEDSKDLKLYNFLISLPDAHSRLSSHYKTVNGVKHYGYDIKDLPDKHKKHLLFAHLPKFIPNSEKEYLYIKPENFGLTTIDDLIGHTGEFIVAQIVKNAALRGMFGLTGDQGQGLQKERVVQAEISMFKALLKEIEPDEAKIKELVAQAAKDSAGTKFIVEMLTEYAKKLDDKKLIKMSDSIKDEYVDVHEDISNEVANFIQKLRIEKDNINIRTGNEVIVTEKTFKDGNQQLRENGSTEQGE